LGKLDEYINKGMLTECHCGKEGRTAVHSALKIAAGQRVQEGSPSKDSTLVLVAVLHKEASRVLRVARRMIACYFDILANSEGVLVIDLCDTVAPGISRGRFARATKVDAHLFSETSALA
jgi:hypothetical protein